MSNVTNKKSGGTTSFSGNPTPSVPPASQFNAHPATAPTSNAATAASPVGVKLSHDAIARAAYLRWQKQGGDSYTNWVEAEKELRAAASAANASQQRK